MLSLTRKVHPSRTRDLDVPLVIEIDRLGRRLLSQKINLAFGLNQDSS